MSTSAYGRIPVIILAALALAACPFKKDKKHDDPAVYWVSASDGSDTNPGTQNSKFKRLTHAMSVATRSGTTVHVAPGTYSNGEIFRTFFQGAGLLSGGEATTVPVPPGGLPPSTSAVGGWAPGALPGRVGVGVFPGSGA